jgi:hypothetical protein
LTVTECDPDATQTPAAMLCEDMRASRKAAQNKGSAATLT